MKTNMLLDYLPLETESGLKINSDFRISIQFELLMQDKELNERDKIALALKLYYDIGKIKDIKLAIKEMLWFYTCGKKEKELANSNNKKDNKIMQIYSYEFDDDYIFSAFLEQYNIDLNTIDYLHWWKFKALFNSLNEDTQISKIMQYRAIDLSKIKDKEIKNYYKKMKKQYSLPDLRTEEEKEHDFGNIFW